MHERLVNTINDLIIKEQMKCNEQIRKKAQKMINLDDFKRKRGGEPVQRSNNSGFTEKMKLEARQLVQVNQPKSKAARPELEEERQRRRREEELMVIKPEDATNVVMMLQQRLARQRTFWAMKNVLMKNKLEEQIIFLENKLSSNISLWQTMKVQDQRQKVLQQELSIT